MSDQTIEHDSPTGDPTEGSRTLREIPRARRRISGNVQVGKQSIKGDEIVSYSEIETRNNSGGDPTGQL